ncbi:hypothetical protein J6590_013680 [Homalodisca vitripennis]|nr:hypothetical protein J6590_013680 [Homalodisca vitripennis]
MESGGMMTIKSTVQRVRKQAPTHIQIVAAGAARKRRWCYLPSSLLLLEDGLSCLLSVITGQLGYLSF